jgi:hypothetical protein
MGIYQIDPLSDPRWPAFLDRHPDASIFHTTGWLTALQHTYAYEPVVYTTSAPGHELANGILFCRVRSWLTGRRLVSLPFADHCQPLVETGEELCVLLDALAHIGCKERWKYIELRPLSSNPTGEEPLACFRQSQDFCFHLLDLRSDLSEIFHGFHKSSVRQPIRRAIREGLTYQDGTSQTLLDQFYYLLLMTRRKHQLPPQPILWFRNLLSCLGEQIKIRLALVDDTPVASIITLSYKNTMVYKYSCSDPRFYNKGGNMALLWQAIQEAKTDTMSHLDMGRSDHRHTGLVTFKDRWGALRSTLTYYRYPSRHCDPMTSDWKMRTAQHLFARLPGRALTAAGNLLYKHMG